MGVLLHSHILCASCIRIGIFPPNFGKWSDFTEMVKSVFRMNLSSLSVFRMKILFPYAQNSWIWSPQYHKHLESTALVFLFSLCLCSIVPTSLPRFQILICSPPRSLTSIHEVFHEPSIQLTVFQFLNFNLLVLQYFSLLSCSFIACIDCLNLKFLHFFLCTCYTQHVC